MGLEKKLIRGSFLLVLAFGLFNFFHFLFQFFMARMLSIEDYGILATLFSITYITLIFTESIQTIITKYSANESDSGKLKNILKKSTRRVLKVSLVLFFLYLIIAIPASSILKINYGLLSLNGFVVFLAFFLPIGRGLMQGRGRFMSLSSNVLVESVSKLVIGMLLVYIGLAVYGAVVAVLLGGAIAFLFSLFQLRDIIRSKEGKAETFGIYEYAKPTFFITAIIVIFYSLDVIIAKIFFSPETAGAYAIASVLGKIIFWGTLPVSKAMFPMSADKNASREKSRNLLINSLGIVILGVVLALAAFFIFPGLIVKIFSGKFVYEAISVLFYVGVAFGLIALANLILLYKLSIGKTKGYLYLGAFIILEAAILSYFSSTVISFSVAFIVASALFLIGTIVIVRKKHA